MPKVGSEQYAVNEEPNSKTSSGTSNVQSFRPIKKSNGVWITVEGVSARVTFAGATPGAGTGPGLIVIANAPAQFFPFRFSPSSVEPGIQFVSAVAGSSIVTPVFCE